MRQKPLGNAEAGFTLLEIIIAMAIMLVAFTSILAVQSGAITASSRARQMNIVGMLARNAMTDLEYEFEGKTFEEMSKEGSKAFSDPYPDYRWIWKIKEIEFPNLSLAAASGDTSGSGGDSDSGADVAQLLTKLLTNYLSKAIREVTVTVFWKKGSGEQSFSVSTYWVNLNHAFELSE